jgi:hypothetical protein
MSGRNEWIGLLVATVVLAGCSKPVPNQTSAAASGKPFAVTAESTAFYRYGPRQGNGPDQTLEKGTLVNLIRPSPGYCKVKLITGEEGFVASEDIKVASKPTPAPSRNEHFRLNPTDRGAGTLSEPLSEFEPTPIPAPPPPEH